MSWHLDGVSDGTFAERLLAQSTPWLTTLAGCPQDPIHHAEGDVLTHVLWVCKELSNLPSFQSLNPEKQQILAWAAALHDIAKPSCTIHESDGRISSPGHATKGAQWARKILWDRNCPLPIREQICGLVHYHMKVFWALDQDDPDRLARTISLRCSCELLSILAEADARGRECSDTQDLLDRIQLFRELAKESGCYQEAYPFASNVARYQYLQNKWHTPDQAPFEDFRCKVWLMSGLPGAGKDTWIQNQGPRVPVVSLDQIRKQMRIAPTGNQAKVVEIAREKAREYLRAKQDFIWNATNISKLIRRKSLSLFLDYNAHVTIVYIDQPLKKLEKQNRERSAAVPWKAIEKMTNQWDVPEPSEAHEILWVSD